MAGGLYHAYALDGDVKLAVPGIGKNRQSGNGITTYPAKGQTD